MTTEPTPGLLGSNDQLGPTSTDWSDSNQREAAMAARWAEAEDRIKQLRAALVEPMVDKRETMRTLLRWIGRKCGLTTWYHVAATYPVPNGYVTMSLTCSVRPWLHSDNYQELVAYVTTQADTKGVKPSIVSLTRLGA